MPFTLADPTKPYKFFHRASGYLHYMENSLTLFGATATQGTFFASTLSSIHAMATPWMPLAHQFLSYLDIAALAESILRVVSGISIWTLSNKLENYELGHDQRELQYKGIWDILKCIPLSFCALLHMSSLGFAITNTLDLFELLKRYNESGDKIAFPPLSNKTELPAKLAEAIGWWLLACGQPVSFIFLGLAFLYKICERIWILSKEATSCVRNEDDDSQQQYSFLFTK